MRADRLVSILMLLQSRGKMSARELAETLEVCERTIYRDINALSAAGIPVYSERGADGGCRLVEDYTTRLTGLTDDETSALYLLTAPGPLDALEVGQKMKAALRKLTAALVMDRGKEPPPICLHLDWAGEGAADSARTQLETLYSAARSGQSVRISYRLWNGPQIYLEVHPLGLVARAGDWYLVYEMQQKIQAQRVSALLTVERLDEGFTPPPGFNLVEYWQQSRSAVQKEARAYPVSLRIHSLARREMASKVEMNELEPADADGWAAVQAAFESLEAARDALLALGGGVEVLEPLALRLSVQDYARQITMRYPAA